MDEAMGIVCPLLEPLARKLADPTRPDASAAEILREAGLRAWTWIGTFGHGDDDETTFARFRAWYEQMVRQVAAEQGERRDGKRGFPRQPPEPVAPDATFLDDGGEETLPEHVGHYRILEVLGVGGMGVVYLAEQTEPIRRRVALKMIKLGIDTEEVIARFESERQALALMSHPHIAHIYEVGATQDGLPYFAMEHIPGPAITEYADRIRMTIRDRLGLFCQLCEGVQHMHQKGIIHRSLKPSNVLVDSRSGSPLVKIIDFGVAKAMNERLTERRVETEYGRIIGTPEFMSPEQAEGTSKDVDTRTDIFSLGLILYELLVGVRAFDAMDLGMAGIDEIRRRIREDELPSPSMRVRTMGEASIYIAERRRTSPSALARNLQGELDWITMKATERDRRRRYSSADELAADLRRFLSGDAVLAVPPAAAYRLRKWIRKSRIAFAAVATLFVGVTFGLGVLTARVVDDELPVWSEAPLLVALFVAWLACAGWLGWRLSRAARASHLPHPGLSSS